MGRFDVEVRELGIGSMLEENVYTEDGKTLLLKKGTSLTEELMESLLKRGIERVRIVRTEPPVTDRTPTPLDGVRHPDIPFTYPSSLKQRLFLNFEGKLILKLDDPTVKQTKQEAIKTARRLMEKVSGSGKVDTSEAFDTASDILESIAVNHQAFINIAGVKEYDEYTFEHSVDVAAYTTIIAKERGLSTDQLADICTGALLHDVGKMLVDPQILNKPGKLTENEFEVMKTHSRKGYDLLKENGVDEHIAVIAHGHHERCDGRGYPQGLTENRLNEPVQMAAIADVYDALTSDRVYKKAMDVTSAMKIIREDSGKQFNKNLVSIFQRTIGIYPIGSHVRLNNGYTARVLDQNEGIVRPVIQLLGDGEGAPLDDQRVINLMENRELYIIACLDEAG